MGLFSQLTKTIIRTATLPVSVVRDVVTMGGVLTGDQESATGEHLKKLVDDVAQLPDSVDD